MPSVVKRGSSFRGFVRLAGLPSESKSFKTHREAKEWATKREIELSSLDMRSPELTVGALIDSYVKEIAPLRKMAPTHLGHDIPQVRRAVGHLRLIDLRGRGLVDWAVKRQKVTRAGNCAIVARLFGVLKQCDMRWSLGVPWADLKASRDMLRSMGLLSDAAARDRRVSDKEIALIKANLKPAVKVRMPDIIDFCLHSAMRIGEVCRIEWNDLDLDAGTVVIRDRKHPRKKYGNHCLVPLMGDTAEILERQPKVSERIFPHDTDYISRLFRLAATKAGVKDVVMHDLRHEAISRLFERGYGIQEVALVSGHRNWRDLARYTHIKPQNLVIREREMKKRSLRQPPHETTQIAAGSAHHEGTQTTTREPLVARGALQV